MWCYNYRHCECVNIRYDIVSVARSSFCTDKILTDSQNSIAATLVLFLHRRLTASNKDLQKKRKKSKASSFTLTSRIVKKTKKHNTQNFEKKNGQ